MQELARLEPLMAHCANVGVKIRVQLEFLPAAYSRIYLENFRDVPLLSLSSAPESELLLFFKRVFDVIVAAFSSVLLAPLLVAIAAAIRITSPGEVLFRQTRCGLGGRRSRCTSSVRWSTTPSNCGPSFISSTNATDRRSRLATTRASRLWAASCAASASTNCRNYGTSCAATCRLWARVRRFRMKWNKYEAWQRRRLRMRPGLTCIWVHRGSQRHRVPSLDPARPRLHRQLVAVARRQDFPAHHPHRDFGPGCILGLMVSVLIVTWNSAAVPRDSASRRSSGRNIGDLEVDRRRQRVHRRDAEPLRLSRTAMARHLQRPNIGFAAGQNQAIRAANGEWLLCLNPDVVLADDFVASWSKPERHIPKPDRSAASCCAGIQSSEPHQTNIIDSTGIYFTRNMRHLDRGCGRNRRRPIRSRCSMCSAPPVRRRCFGARSSMLSRWTASSSTKNSSPIAKTPTWHGVRK